MPDNHQVVRYGRDQMEQDEDPATEEIMTGDLVEEVAGGVQRHATDAEQIAVPKVAVDRLPNKELGDTYQIDENTIYKRLRGGGVHLNLAAGENVTEDTELVSNGNGAVRAFDSAAGDDRNAIVAVTEEALDNSGGAERTPIGVEVAN